MNNYTDSNVSSQVHLSVNVILGLFSFVVSNWNKMMAQTIVFYTLSAVHCSFNLYESINCWKLWKRVIVHQQKWKLLFLFFKVIAMIFAYCNNRNTKCWTAPLIVTFHWSAYLFSQLIRRNLEKMKKQLKL
jgi:hypothetical protein